MIYDHKIIKSVKAMTPQFTSLFLVTTEKYFLHITAKNLNRKSNFFKEYIL